MSLPAALPYPPGDQEKAEYYDGLRDCPKLVARTSATPFVPNEIRDRYMFSKHYKQRKPIRNHGLIAVYNRSFAADIISNLGDYPWHRFYPIRMHDDLAGEKPVLFIIEVLCESEPWETSIRVALACRNVIRSMGITDVEIEIQQVTETQFAVNKEVDVFTETTHAAIIKEENRDFRGILQKIHNNIYDFSSRIGCEIKNPKFKKAGSLGLHLKLGDESPLYGLTCRHVVFEDINLPSADFNIDVSGDKSALIQQLSQSTAAGLVKDSFKSAELSPHQQMGKPRNCQ
ncbi:hypothetical protein V8C35DRAFT_282376 [Trichoderma chlorosporum]